MKAKKKIGSEIEIPEGCDVQLSNGQFTVKGEKGEVTRTLSSPTISSAMADKKVTFVANKSSKREKKLVNTFVAHLKNMFRGVTYGHIYKLKICSGHFPMSVAVKDNLFEVKNFIGETIPRQLEFDSKNVSVKIEGTEIIVEGVDKELTGQTAASIEKLTKRLGFDNRIFQDGIYLIEKDGKPIK